MRLIVIDANVWISAVIWGGNPAKVIELAENKEIIILVTPEILDEITDVLEYDRIKKAYENAGKTKSEILARILSIAKVVNISEAGGEGPYVIEDPDDDKFIDLALFAGADYIVSGDHHLLNMKQVKDIEIISVIEYLSRVSKKG